MKKFMMLALVLTMILGLNGVMMAAEPAKCDPPPCLVGVVKITADVPFYAQVKVVDSLILSLNPGGPCDGDNAKATGEVDFTIRTNYQVNVKAELEGLKNTRWTDERNQIKTTATINYGSNQPKVLVVNANSSRTARDEFQLPKQGRNYSGRGAYNVNASILGQLGRIEDQAMGQYTGKLTLTVVAPS